MKRLCASVLGGLLLVGCAGEAASPEPSPPPGTVTILATHPHDDTAFTQGLEVLGPDLLLESTGLTGESRVVITDLTTGEEQARHELADDLFGEGITAVGDELVQVTWRSGQGFRYSEDLKLLDTFTYAGEGWGVCYDEEREVIFRSDGSGTDLHRHDPDTFAEEGSEPVTRDGAALANLNELECHDGEVWGNIWLTDEIVRLDPDTGEVLNTFDLTAVREQAEAAAGRALDARREVLNGLAWDPHREVWLVTGKLWPVLFEVEMTT